MSKILIIKRDKIGDMLLMTPMLENLRRSRPDIEINVLANDYNSWVLHGNPNVDRLWVYPRSRHNGQLRLTAPLRELYMTLYLRRLGFDFVIAAGGVVSPRAIQRAVRIRGKRTVAFFDTTCKIEISDPIALPKGLHEVDANHLLLSAIGVPPPKSTIWPHYSPPESCISLAKQWISDNALTDGFIVIGINSRRNKRKPSNEQIISWSDAIYRQSKMKTVLVWQPGSEDSKLYPGDDKRIHELMPKLPAYVVPYKAENDVRPLLGLIWHAKTTIVPDGGLAHLASVSPGGVLALFAETDISPHPDNWRPYSPRGDYLVADKSVSELSSSIVIEKITKLIS